MKKVTRCLPKNNEQKKLVVLAIAESVGLVCQPLKDQVVALHCQNDVSYQMAGKRDTIVMRENNIKSTHQKRILLYSVGEAHRLFLSEYTNSSESSLRDIVKEK